MAYSFGFFHSKFFFLILSLKGADWGDGDVMKFILPGFCQLIGEDVPRAILIQAKFHIVLQKYLDSLVTVISSQK